MRNDFILLSRMSRLFLLAGLPLAVGLLLLAGCEDMPELASDPTPQRASLSAGPYILLDDAATPDTVRFRTDAPCVPGLRSSKQQKMTQRFGASQTNHALSLQQLMAAGGSETIQLLLDDTPAVRLELASIPAGNPVTVGFLGGGADDTVALAEAAKRLSALKSTTAVMTGGSFPAENKLAQWDAKFFNPIRPLAQTTPFFLLPETRKILPTEAAPAPKVPYWSNNRGCVHLVFFDLDELRSPATREPVLDWLRRDLAANTQPWCVVVLSQPLFGATKIHARAVEALGTILEAGGVDLVVSGGANYYFRSLPVKAGGAGAIRYVVTGGLQATTGKGAPAGREYKAASANTPHYCVLNATKEKLEWKVYPYSAVGGVQPAPVDELTISSDGSSAQGEPAVEKMDILTDALSTLSLQREVLTVAREAARAVDDPTQKQELSIIIANASPREVSGELVWDLPAAGAYAIDPAAVRYNLKSGYEGVVNFTVTPDARTPDAPMPTLAVNMKGVGSARQQLILTKRKTATIRPALGLQADGVLSEPGWSGATELTGFGVIGGGGAPKQPIQARIAYDPKGIYAIVRCAAKDARTIAAKATNHDDPVHLDESVELFLCPRNQAREYYQFAVNIKGVTLDRSSAHGLAWNPTWESMVDRQKDFYTVEFFIPYQALGLTAEPPLGTRWGLNISRNDYQATAVHEDPFAAKPGSSAGSAPAATTQVGRINRFNIGKIAEMDLGKKSAAAPAAPAEAVPGSGVEVVQWADTFGSNARSGLYGTITFEQAALPTPAPTPTTTPAGSPAPATPAAPTGNAGVTTPAAAALAPTAPVTSVTPATSAKVPAPAAPATPTTGGRAGTPLDYTPLPAATGTSSGGARTPATGTPAPAKPVAPTPQPAPSGIEAAPEIPQIPAIPGSN